MLDVLFPLNGRTDVIMSLCPHKPLQLVPVGEALNSAFAMLPNTFGEVARYSDI